jgi:hypothetical protein
VFAEPRTPAVAASYVGLAVPGLGDAVAPGLTEADMIAARNYNSRLFSRRRKCASCHQEKDRSEFPGPRSTQCTACRNAGA